MRDAGYDLGDGSPAWTSPTTTEAGDALIHALIDAGGQDPDWLTDEQLAGNPIRMPASDYREWFDDLPAELTDAVTEHWGPAPGRAVRRPHAIPTARSSSPHCRPATSCSWSSRRAGSARTRSRSTTTRPAAVPPLPGRLPLAGTTGSAPTPSCTSASTATWSGCPARRWACRRRCGTDAALGDLPLIYPFLVNDPGEGTQAKRRAHAVDRRPPDPADGPRRDLRRHRPARAAARRARQHRRDGPGQAARHPRSRSGR